MGILGEASTELVGFLERGEWKNADKETGRIIAASVGSDGEDGLSDRELASADPRLFSDLDELWTAYSYGRFGFSRQAAAWARAEGDVGLFATFVGWRRRNAYVNYHALNFDLSAPHGHLPVGGPLGIYPRLEDCKVDGIFREMMKSALGEAREVGFSTFAARLFVRTPLASGKEFPRGFITPCWASARPAVLAKLVDHGLVDAEEGESPTREGS